MLLKKKKKCFYNLRFCNHQFALYKIIKFKNCVFCIIPYLIKYMFINKKFISETDVNVNIWRVNQEIVNNSASLIIGLKDKEKCNSSKWLRRKSECDIEFFFWQM